MSEMHSDQGTRFLCDQNLGRLSRWLRILGFDTEYMRTWDRTRLRAARKEKRIVLTRKRSMSTQEGAVVIQSDRVLDQLRELSMQADLGKGFKPFSRCSLCNSLLEAVPREDIKGLVPEYTYLTQETFSRCPSCGRIYWKGTHFNRAQRIMRTIFASGGRA
ncbi:MAG: Mut7-C RNAse domain-containing protein [Desulfomonilia bacterium]